MSDRNSFRAVAALLAVPVACGMEEDSCLILDRQTTNDVTLAERACRNELCFSATDPPTLH